jgi:hypothetical protein
MTLEELGSKLAALVTRVERVRELEADPVVSMQVRVKAQQRAYQWAELASSNALRSMVACFFFLRSFPSSSLARTSGRVR